VAKAPFDIKTIDLTVATKPLYAGVGIADLAVEAVRDYAADVQKKLTDVRGDIKSFDFSTNALRTQATARVNELQSEAKTLPTKAQKYLDENVSTVYGTYGELVNRGEGLVKRIRSQESTKATAKSAKTTTAKAKTTKTQATKATKSTAASTKSTAKSTAKKATKKSAPARSSAKATGTAAKKTATSAAKATTDAAAKVGD
jgi:heparin binding hemagglutinin HbhA